MWNRCLPPRKPVTVSNSVRQVTVPDYGFLYMSYNLFQALFEARGGSGSEPLAPPSILHRPASRLASCTILSTSESPYSSASASSSWPGAPREFGRLSISSTVSARIFSHWWTQAGRAGSKALPAHGQGRRDALRRFLRSGIEGSSERYSLHCGLDATRIAEGSTRPSADSSLASRASSHPSHRTRPGSTSRRFFWCRRLRRARLCASLFELRKRLMASLGFSRAIGDLRRWTISAEGFYNFLGSDLTGDARPYRPRRRSTLGLGMAMLPSQRKSYFRPISRLAFLD